MNSVFAEPALRELMSSFWNVTNENSEFSDIVLVPSTNREFPYRYIVCRINNNYCFLSNAKTQNILTSSCDMIMKFE